MHISAASRPILSAAYHGRMQTPNQASSPFRVAPVFLSHSPLQRPVLHRYSAFQNMEGKAKNRDSHFRPLERKKKKRKTLKKENIYKNNRTQNKHTHKQVHTHTLDKLHY